MYTYLYILCNVPPTDSYNTGCIESFCKLVFNVNKCFEEKRAITIIEFELSAEL